MVDGLVNAMIKVKRCLGGMGVFLQEERWHPNRKKVWLKAGDRWYLVHHKKELWKSVREGDSICESVNIDDWSEAVERRAVILYVYPTGTVYFVPARALADAEKRLNKSSGDVEMVFSVKRLRPFGV